MKNCALVSQPPWPRSTMQFSVVYLTWSKIKLRCQVGSVCKSCDGKKSLSFKKEKLCSKDQRKKCAHTHSACFFGFMYNFLTFFRETKMTGPKIDLGDITQHNVNLLKLINQKVFPGRMFFVIFSISGVCKWFQTFLVAMDS